MNLVSLPIDSKKEEILTAVAGNKVVIVQAETGAGKSTRVPQFLLEAGYDVVITQPRRLAARTVAQRVADEVGVQLGQLVGFRTGEDKDFDCEDTRCLFVTDGLQLIREIMGHVRASAGTRVLIIDEVHEQNINMDVLMAWCKRELAFGADFKIVCMSATLQAQKLAAYFAGAPVVSVPGRTFPVQEVMPGRSMFSDAIEMLLHGRNVLVFQPGKGEILDFVARLKGEKINAVVLPLYGELTAEEQGKCFKSYGRPKCVVSTNVAQTSVTIADIDGVIDCGMERRIELVDGVEGLYLKPISKADGMQRRGRAGRTKPGVYIDYCPTSPDERLEFPVPEILRTRLDQTVLRLAMAGLDAEQLQFLNQPNTREIHDARRSLKVLGCMDETGAVTEVGREVARMPVSVQYARMIVEASKRGVIDDVLTIAAILEQKGIIDKKCRVHEMTKENESDCLAQLDIFQQATSMNPEEMSFQGILPKRYNDAVKRRQLLVESLQGKVHFGSTGNREDILKSVWLGMLDNVYRGSGTLVRDGYGNTRNIPDESACYAEGFVVGIPFDTDRKQFLNMVSKVDLDQLIELAPHLLRSETGTNARYDSGLDAVISTRRRLFNRLQLLNEDSVDMAHPQANELFASWVAKQMG